MTDTYTPMTAQKRAIIEIQFYTFNILYDLYAIESEKGCGTILVGPQDFAAHSCGIPKYSKQKTRLSNQRVNRFQD